MIAYTAIFGGYDVPKRHPAHKAVSEWRLYSDQDIHAPGWRVVVVEPLDAPADAFVASARMRAKWFKCNPPVDYNKSLYLDGSVVLSGTGLLEEALVFDGEWGAYRHQARDCILEEAKASMVQKKYEGQPLVRQAEHYFSTNLVRPHGGLWAAGILVRRHTKKTMAAGRDWWIECGNWRITQDEIALPYVLALHGIEPGTLKSGGSVSNNTGFNFGRRS